MKRTVLLLLAGIAVPAAAEAQNNAMTIERALAAAPARAREATSVVRWNADHSYTFIKEGTGPLVCYDRSGEPGRRAFAVQCTSRANLDRLAQNRRFAAEGEDGAAVRALVAAAEANGTRVPAEFGSVWIQMNGDTREAAGRHMTIAVPGATAASLGLPENGQAGGVYVMAGGTSEAHIMTPG